MRRWMFLEKAKKFRSLFHYGEYYFALYGGRRNLGLEFSYTTSIV